MRPEPTSDTGLCLQWPYSASLCGSAKANVLQSLEHVGQIQIGADLVPKPRINLTRYHGVLAPNHRWRGEVSPAKHGKDPKMGANAEVTTPAECHAAMTWAQRLKRVSMGRPSASTSKSAAAAVDLSESSSMRRTGASRTRTS